MLAIGTWDAQNEHQLSFGEGEMITVLNKFEGQAAYDGWVWFHLLTREFYCREFGSMAFSACLLFPAYLEYQGQIAEYVGLFPVNYTTPYQGRSFQNDPTKTSSKVAKMQKDLGSFLLLNKLSFLLCRWLENEPDENEKPLNNSENVLFLDFALFYERSHPTNRKNTFLTKLLRHRQSSPQNRKSRSFCDDLLSCHDHRNLSQLLTCPTHQPSQFSARLS